MTNERELRSWSFVSLLVGGVLIVVGGLMGATMMGSGWMPMAGMMGSAMGDAWLADMAWWMGGVGVASGAVVLLAASRVYRARDMASWGVVAIVAGAFSLFAMGGFVLGAFAAIAGGALALVGERRPLGGEA